LYLGDFLHANLIAFGRNGVLEADGEVGVLAGTKSGDAYRLRIAPDIVSALSHFEIHDAVNAVIDVFPSEIEWDRRKDDEAIDGINLLWMARKRAHT